MAAALQQVTVAATVMAQSVDGPAGVIELTVTLTNHMILPSHLRQFHHGIFYAASFCPPPIARAVGQP